MARNTVYNRRVTLRITDEMFDLLVTDMKGGADLADHLRKIIRNHLDESETVRANRRANRHVVLEESKRLRWYMALVVTLLANIGSILITNLLKLPESEKELFTPNGLLRHAEAETESFGWRVLERIDLAVNQGQAIERQQADQQT